MRSELEPTAPDGAPAEVPLLRERDGRVLILTLSRPERLNALTRELHRQLHEAVLDASRDTEIGAVILTGAGRAFCSGGDLGDRKHSAAAPPTVEQRADELLQHSETARLLHEMPKPTLAMINGVAAGSGLSLALACDFRLASRSAVLTTAYAKIALSGDLGVSYFLTHLVGAARARELLFFSDKIDAAEAQRLGLVNRLIEDADLRDTTLQIARQLANGPSVAFRYMKRNLILAGNGGLREVLESEAYGMARCGRTQDVKEAALAFRDKRAPVFKGS